MPDVGCTTRLSCYCNQHMLKMPCVRDRLGSSSEEKTVIFYSLDRKN